MDLLDNVIQPYAWGSRSAIARLQSRPVPSPGPEAELWMGAHPAAPSRIAGTPLLELIARDPSSALGASCVARFGPRLPFLLKVLAAEAPLSLQAHPSLQQAKEGFAREDAAGIPRDAPHRSYKDPNHKPELLCALEPFDALCGFRAAEQTVQLLESLGVPALAPILEPLRAGDEGLRAAFERLMTLPEAARVPLVDAVVAACARGGAFEAEKKWAVALGAQYPGDAGVVGALLLNLVRLSPGEAIYLPAGNLHAYLRGVGVEVMASSDNVLRGGCTPKHVDVPELLRVVDFRPMTVAPLRPLREGEVEWRYQTPAPDFRLSRLALEGGARFDAAGGVPEIVLCVEGALTLEGARATVALKRGQATFVRADDGAWRASGTGVAFRATAGEGFGL